VLLSEGGLMGPGDSVDMASSRCPAHRGGTPRNRGKNPNRLGRGPKKIYSDILRENAS